MQINVVQDSSSGCDDGSSEVVTLASPSVQPRMSYLHGIALTANDLQDPTKQEHQENHDKSQEALRMILEHRGILSDSKAPFVSRDEEHDETDDDHKRHDFTRRIVGKLRERGIHGIRNFRMMLHHMDTERAGTVLARTFEGALAHMGIRLKASEWERLLELYCLDDDEETVDYVKFLAYGVSNWSDQRQEVVNEAYDVLREKCPGGLLAGHMLEKTFKPWALTQALVPDLVEHESTMEFLTQWSDSNLAADGIIRWNDFLDYYLDISLSFDSDQDFCTFVCKSWDINPDDWLAKKVFRRFTNPDTENCLMYDDFIRMLAELDPTTSEEEAKAWYEAIDEDHDGQVSLDEFLSCKILKVKRLFDEFDTEDTRTATKATMLKILKSLNDCITPEEAEAVYSYADLDNNGDISFSEFLENNLLKLLQIFDDFDRNRSRAFNEAEMKMMLLKLDPYLDDHDVQSIYKAIDVDSSGEISFIEFCESHVLRAKALFDRYDTTRSRALTQFKFRELMMDMDNTLTSKEMEAIYNLVMDTNDAKVHLGGFLNPNIVKLKMLFDKYDEDRSRYLDIDEFRCMLRDMYKSCTKSEIQTLVELICPPGGEQGLSFTTYIHRFKEISRKHDLIHLAKRRAAREKAKKKGLVWCG